MDTNPEILHFASSSPLRGSLADYAKSWESTIKHTQGLAITSLLHHRVPENIEDHPEYIQYVRRFTAQALRERGDLPEQLFHADLGVDGRREFWALQVAGRLRPHTPICLVLHDPPNLPQPTPRYRPRAKAGWIESFLNRLAANLQRYGQERLMARFLNRVDVLMTNSQRSAEMLVQRWPGYADKVAWCPPTLVGSLPPADIEPNTRKVSDPIRVTFFGFIRPDKGIEELLDALRMFHQRESLVGRAVVRIRGRISPAHKESGLVQQINRRIESMELGWLVDFKAGNLPGESVQQLLSETDILVLPYRTQHSKGISRTLLRAAPWCVAVIGTDIPAIREVIDDEDSGLLYASESPNELAGHLQRVFNDGELRFRLANTLRERVLENFGPKVSGEIMCEVYDAMLKARAEGRAVEIPAVCRPSGGLHV